MALPARLQEIVDLFAEAPRELRLEALMEYSQGLPPLPESLQADHGAMERVVECQSPFFLATELTPDKHVRLWFDSPPEAPTTRGFAGILAAGLDGAPAEEILAVPNDFYEAMGLAELISSLRLRGMSAIVFRLKSQIRASLAEALAGAQEAS